MDSATLTDNNGYKANFKNVVLIMTSNIGAQAASVMGFNADQRLSKDVDLKAFFTPEFRNRLDAVINFAPLEMDIVESIVDKFVAQLNVQLSKRKVVVSVSPKARGYLAEMGYDQAMGARPLERVIQERIKNELTNEMLFGVLKEGGKVFVDFKEKLTFSFSE